MKLTMVMVQTLNGRITNGDDPNPGKWASEEDQKHFYSTLATNKVFIMGSTTFDVANGKKLPEDGKLRVVITRDPQKYASIAKPELFEFTSDPPADIISALAGRGHIEALLIGGGKINSLFLKAGLVTHLSISLEPKLFGNGKLVVDEIEGLNADLKLISSEKLNERGTLLLTYEVIQ